MKTIASARPRDLLSFPFFCIRNITSPEDAVNERKVFAGQIPLRSILGIPTDENVRDYLVDAEGKLRRASTQVHKAIKETLTNNPEEFSILNSGVTIVARDIEIEEKERKLTLLKPSIINGSQTQGVIADYFERAKAEGKEPANVHMKFEVIVTQDEDLIAETSIARNFQNDVMTISIVGRLGQLDELEKAIKAKMPDAQLKMSETQLSEDYIKTEKLIQVLAALTPAELWPNDDEAENPNKVYTYSKKTKCLKDFQRIYEKAHNKKDEEHGKYQKLYQFYLEIGADAIALYEKWKSHQGFRGTALRAIEREGDEIIDVPDGIIFPIVASLSAFAVKTPRGWKIQPPEQFNDVELIRAAKSTYQEIAKSNPQTMGKSKACYSALYQITSIYRRLSK
jgi:hypothetical protein